MEFAMKSRWKRLTVTLAAAGIMGLTMLPPVAGQEIEMLNSPKVVQPSVQLELLQETPVAAGVQHFTYQGTLADGQPIMVQVIRADLAHPEVTVKPVAAEEGIYGKRESVRSMGARTGAVAAVNGGFYNTSPPYAPVGSVVIDGELQVASNILRTSLGWLEDGSVRFGYFNPQSYLELENGLRLPVDRINQEREEDGEEGIILYTPEWGELVGSGDEGEALVSLAPRDGGSYQVSYVSQGMAGIPGGGYVVSLPGADPVLGQLTPGRPVKVSLGQDPYWPGLKHLITGGPLLVEEGRPVFQYALEGLAGSLAARHPRTAIGLTDQGQVLLVTVDGRQPGVSVGVTFEELAFLMMELGAVEAMGLDGGGSTTAWVNGQVVNRVSDGSQRVVANGIIVRSGIAVFVDGKRIYFDVAPRLEEGRTLVPLRAFFEGLGAKVDWQEETRTVIAVKGEQSIRLPVGSQSALVNGEEVLLDVPAKVEDGRTLVPLRFVGEALGAEVTWDPAKIITVNSTGEGSQ
jgi:hypothetical protein